MSRAVEHFKAQGVTCFIFGDIFLHDVRKYREQKLAPHGIGIAEPLWGKSSSDVMHDFLCLGAQDGHRHHDGRQPGADAVGREIDPAFIASLPAGVDPNGENGEYHNSATTGRSSAPPSRSGSARLCAEVTASALTTGRKKSYSYWFADLQQA